MTAPTIRYSIKVKPSPTTPGTWAWIVRAHEHTGEGGWTSRTVTTGRETTEPLAHRVAACTRLRLTHPADTLITTSEAAWLMDVSVKTIRSWETRGYLQRASTEPTLWRLADLLAAEEVTRKTGQIRPPAYKQTLMTNTRVNQG